MNVHLQLDLACEGGGGGMKGVETREVVMARTAGCGVHERAARIQRVFNVSMDTEWKLLKVGEPIMAPLLTYLAGLP